MSTRLIKMANSRLSGTLSADSNLMHCYMRLLIRNRRISVVTSMYILAFSSKKFLLS